MPKDGWQKLELTASDDLIKFIDDWKDKHKFETRASAARDLLEWARAHVGDPDQQLVTRRDLREEIARIVRETKPAPPGKPRERRLDDG